MADGIWATSLLAVVEFFSVGVLQRAQLVGAFELGYAALWLTPLVLLLSVPAGIAAGVCAAVIARGEQRAWRVGAALLGALYGAAVGYGVSDGRHLEGGLRAPFVAFLALVAAAASFALAPRLGRLLGSSEPRRRRLFALTLLALVAVAELANATVLVRLYDGFHGGLAALSILLFVLATGALMAGFAGKSRSFAARGSAALALVAAGAAFATPAAESLGSADNIRRVFGTEAPLLRHAVALGTWLAPPAALDDATEVATPSTAGGGVALDGADIVLISVDALRADHVGAYGYARNTTPNIDKLAAQGVLFEAAYTATPHTSYAVTSLMAGKYMRPLLLQGLGADTETWAAHLRRYGYRTAAFYPPAVFFIDAERFAPFAKSGLDFEYRKEQFASATERVDEVRSYVATLTETDRLFLWVHLFEPHEPYEAHAEFPFGDRDIDRYDAEIATADAAIGKLVEAVRAKRPRALVIVTSDHGEEFSEHGGRYHGTTVYEEQVRVPLVWNAPGILSAARRSQPVQLIDLLPTVLSGLSIPRPARLRGSDLGPSLAGSGADTVGFAFAESETQTLLARGALRLVCERRLGACALYNTADDPGEKRDLGGSRAEEKERMFRELRALEASHGRYETSGLRSEGRGFPEAIRRGISGDVDAAGDVAGLLDDADVAIRRKAAEVLFDLRREETSTDLRLALTRDEDPEVRSFAALALTRLGHGAPLTRELVVGKDARLRRLAALALAESGDDRGEAELLAWFRAAYPAKPDKPRESVAFERAREIARALGHIRSKAAIRPLIDALDDVRLRPELAAALADIGEDAARPALAEQLANERYHTTRVALFDALIRLGAKPELRSPLVRFLGTPDPLPNGLAIAQRADLLDLVGGPRDRDLVRLKRFATSSVAVGFLVPPGDETRGTRLICRVRSKDGHAGEVRAGRSKGGPRAPSTGPSLVPASAPVLDPDRSVALAVPADSEIREIFATLPASIQARPSKVVQLVIYATQNVELLACAVVPLSDEIPPPPPRPWAPDEPPE